MIKIQNIIENVPEDIKNHLIYRGYDKGNSVITQGVSTDYLYIVIDGSIEVCLQTYQGINISIQTYNAPNSFGILEIFDPGLKTKSVIAKTDCKIISINKRYVLEWMKLDFNFNLYIISLLSTCFRQANSVATTLASMTIKERLLLRIYNHFKIGDLEKLRKSVLIQEVCVPVRSLNRSISECIDEGLIIYQNKKISLKNESMIYDYINPFL